MQWEVAQRLVATPKSKDYGILSVVFQLYARPRVNFKIPPTVFYPQPKVDSALVTIDFLPSREPFPVAAKDLRRVVTTAFQQRRKMLRSSLAKLPAIAREERTGRRRGAEIGTAGAEALCAMAGVGHTLRAGAVSVAEFGRLAEVRIEQQQQHSPPSDCD